MRYSIVSGSVLIYTNFKIISYAISKISHGNVGLDLTVGYGKVV